MIKYNNYDFQKFYEKYSKLEAINLLELMIKKVFHKKIAVTSSFGAESVVILDLISKEKFSSISLCLLKSSFITFSATINRSFKSSFVNYSNSP